MKIKAGTIIFLLLGFLLFLPGAYAGEADTYYNRGNAHLHKGEYEEAISNYTKALEIEPQSAEVYASRGLAYSQIGQNDKAISDFNKALEINPQYALAYNNRAVVYYTIKEYDKAWKDVHKAQKLGYQANPEFIKALRDASGRNE
ncbi:MAG: tetratricopeptide repeat protein [Planctomycetes bacterium]|nr:tetratricopeptide repeat protein [Planctomycetota bacterium]